MRLGFTLLELVVVLLVLGTLAAITVPTFQRIRENSLKGVVDAMLESSARTGEATCLSDTDLSLSEVATAAADGLDGRGAVVTTDADSVTVSRSAGSLTAEGSVTFTLCASTITPATITTGSSPTASTTTTSLPASTSTTAPTTTTMVPVSPYSVGDTGPGGGIVFAVFATPFACGPTLNLTCTYLEAAVDGWAGNGDQEPFLGWSGSTITAVATDTGLGYGYQNTLAAVTQNSTANRAVTVAESFTYDGVSDWFLPSQVELNELCKYARQQTTGDTTQACNTAGSLRSGFANHSYWSSTTATASSAFRQNFNTGSQFSASKASTYPVRPIRAG